MAYDRRTPGIPGVFGDLQWVDSPDYGEPTENRRVQRMYDVDPAPLARLIATYTSIITGDLDAAMHAVADDDRDGPIHIVHLLGACEYAGRQYGGGLPTGSTPLGEGSSHLVPAAIAGDILTTLVDALHEGGFPAATAAARNLSHDERYRLLDVLLQYWGAPISGLQLDFEENRFRQLKS